LEKEAHIDMLKAVPADNMDLLTIFQEFEAYYEIKFGKAPKLIRSIQKDAKEPKKKIEKSYKPNVFTKTDKNKNENEPVKNDNLAKHEKENKAKKTDTFEGFSAEIVGSSGLRKTDHSIELNLVPNIRGITLNKPVNEEEMLGSNEGPTKSLPSEYDSMEWRELAYSIQREIISEDPRVNWDDIVGLDQAKEIIKEATVYPLKFPELFEGWMSPWKAILLYGVDYIMRFNLSHLVQERRYLPKQWPQNAKRRFLISVHHR
jgi:katanin p60 ATPase-containing subunit A1